MVLKLHLKNYNFISCHFLAVVTFKLIEYFICTERQNINQVIKYEFEKKSRGKSNGNLLDRITQYNSNTI